MKRMLIVVWTVFIALTALADQKPGASPRDSLLVTPAWLRAHLGDRDLVLLHVGTEPDYKAKHIPGARRATMADLSVSDHSGKGLMLELPAAEELRARLEALGISDSSRIVIYFDKDWVSPATRIFLTLDHAGLGARTSLLDGGQNAWVRSGNEVTDAVTPVKKGSLSPLKLRQVTVDGAFVRANLRKPGTVIVDGRAAVFYDGVDTGGSHDQQHLTGHITGARSIPFTEMTRDDLTFRSTDELRTLFTASGVKPGDTVVGYCHIGQQATAMLFAARLLGHSALLYDGSFEDWSLFQKGPVEGPVKKAAP